VLHEGTCWNPRVSPKGDRVAFRTAEGGRCEVRVVDLSGKAIPWPPPSARSAAWSPSVRKSGSRNGRSSARLPSAGSSALMRAPANDVSADGRALVTTAQLYNGLIFAGPGDTKERDLAWFEGRSWARCRAMASRFYSVTAEPAPVHPFRCTPTCAEPTEVPRCVSARARACRFHRTANGGSPCSSPGRRGRYPPTLHGRASCCRPDPESLGRCRWVTWNANTRASSPTAREFSSPAAHRAVPAASMFRISTEDRGARSRPRVRSRSLP
jgi:hypothetical protein